MSEPLGHCESHGWQRRGKAPHARAESCVGWEAVEPAPPSTAPAGSVAMLCGCFKYNDGSAFLCPKDAELQEHLLDALSEQNAAMNRTGVASYHAVERWRGMHRHRALSVGEVSAMLAELVRIQDGDDYKPAELRLARLTEALRIIEDWTLPPATYKLYQDGTPTGEVVPCSYETAYGSNGAREYVREVARAALATDAPGERMRGPTMLCVMCEKNPVTRHVGAPLCDTCEMP